MQEEADTQVEKTKNPMKILNPNQADVSIVSISKCENVLDPHSVNI
jgi:hypothetical protein